MKTKLVVSLACLLFAGYAHGQEGDRQEVLVGTLDTKTDERHVFALDNALITVATNTRSPLVARAFVAQTSKKDCCKPVKVSSHVWICCDGRYLVTTNEAYSSMISEIPKTTEREWSAAMESHLNSVENWAPVGAALKERPPVELKSTDPRFKAFQWKEAEAAAFKPADKAQ
jgi:hypothetical protein